MTDFHFHWPRVAGTKGFIIVPGCTASMFSDFHARPGIEIRTSLFPRLVPFCVFRLGEGNGSCREVPSFSLSFCLLFFLLLLFFFFFSAWRMCFIIIIIIIIIVFLLLLFPIKTNIFLSFSSLFPHLKQIHAFFFFLGGGGGAG